MSPHSLLALLLSYYLPLYLIQHALIVLDRPPIIGSFKNVLVPLNIIYF